ncbi:Signal transduction histidine kinase [Rhizobiales bacterium GAS191]|nr:Signal transduction histidine kinase [Rhizobiales bacterium GAS113]SEE54948.1 Signal transduction histidine kinase [Rhizobiales bacterium GAS191]
MARFDAAVPPMHASVSGQATRSGKAREFRHGRVLMQLMLVLLSGLVAALVIAETLVNLYSAREQHLAQSLEQSDAVASLIAERLDHMVATARLANDSASDPQKLLAAALPLRSPGSDMLIGVTDHAGQMVASIGFRRQISSLADLIGRQHIAYSNRTGAARVTTPDGVDAIVAVRDLAEPLGQVAILMPTSRMLTLWREHALQLARVAAIAGFIILLLSGGVLWQRRRARTAQGDSDRVRMHMRAALMDIWRNEQELIEKEQRLMATLTDLERSRLAVERQSCELAALADRYLDQRQRAENANRAKAEFLANMSHELRTPLNAIIGFSEIMETGLFGALGSEKYGEYVSDIRRSGQYLLAVLSDILEMARIESGRRRIERCKVSLKDLIGEAAVSVAGAAEAKKLTLTVSAPAAALIDGDHRALVKVLVHLARNGINHTPEGGRVTIKAKLYPSHVGVHIADTGIGIPADRLPHLGQPFQRVSVDATKSGSGSGSGLGLAIARSLVELHGGRLRIKSREGLGTVVALSLPRQPALEDQAAAAMLAAEPPAKAA